jgi:hypothetical protein
METVLVRELKDKDLLPPGPRKAVLFIGDDNFEEIYKKLVEIKRNKLEEEKMNKKMLSKLQENNEEV